MVHNYRTPTITAPYHPKMAVYAHLLRMYSQPKPNNMIFNPHYYAAKLNHLH
jgi:hypothetical protein